MRQLTIDEIIAQVRTFSERVRWEQVRSLVISLYGPMARFVTCSTGTQNISPIDSITGPQFIVTDSQHKVMPFDLAAVWWQQQTLDTSTQALVLQAHGDAIIGLSLPDDLCDAVQQAVAIATGIETFYSFEDAPVAVATWDLDLCPPLPFARTVPMLLATEWGIVGADWLERRQWERAREYTHMLYGPQAAQLILKCTFQYNDNTYAESLHTKVTNVNGEEIDYDFSLPWWQQLKMPQGWKDEHTEQVAEAIASDEYDEDTFVTTPITDIAALRMLQHHLLAVKFIEVEDDDDIIYSQATTYDFTRAPTIPLTAIFVDE